MRTKYIIPQKMIAIPNGEGSLALPITFVLRHLMRIPQSLNIDHGLPMER
jgi:hypothetical protein